MYSLAKATVQIEKGFRDVWASVCSQLCLFLLTQSEVVGRNIDDWKTFLVPRREYTGDESI